MFNFTEEQKSAALTLGIPMVVTAAAGSGKTTVLVARYLELLKSGLKPNEILTVTFTTDAAHQLKLRIKKALEKEESLAGLIEDVERTRFIGTIHSFCYFLLSEYGTLLGYPPIEEIMSDYQFQVAIDQSYRQWLNSLEPAQLTDFLSYMTRNDLKEVFCAFYEAKYDMTHFSNELSHERALNTFYSSVAPFLRKLEDSLFSEGLYRFNDLEQLSVLLLKNHSGVRSKLQSQFKSFLIDEFQDTSQSQWTLFQLLIGENHSKLFVVGDPKQSIYSFRHADVSLFSRVSQLTESWGGRIAELNTNFRTQSTLISDINRLSQHFFESSPIPFHPMISGTERSGEGIKIHSYDCHTADGSKLDKKEIELNCVLGAIDEYLAQGKKLNDLALLFRMGDRIDAYAAALKNRGLAVDCTQTLSLFSHHDVLNLNHYLKALHRPSDSFSLSAFLFSPWMGTPITTLANLRDDETALPFEEKVKQHFSPNLNWFFALAEKPRISVREALFELFSNTHYFPAQSEAFLEWLKPLTEKHYEIKEALNDLDLWKKEGILFKAKHGNSSVDAIKLMTVHASKGLEFEHVFLVDNLRKSPTQLPVLLTSPSERPSMKYREKGEIIIPKQYARLKELKEQLDNEEARRILYVALTRAKTSLSFFLPSDMKGVPKGSWASLLSEALAN